jgi:hypothetical protein
LCLLRGLLAGLGGWGVMLLATPAPALAIAGFSGSFDPSTWLVVNTYNQPTPPDPSTLSGISNSSVSTLCQGTTAPSGTSGPNEVACIETFTPEGSLSLLSSYEGFIGGGTAGKTTTTTFSLTNPYPSDYEYRRVYLISFEWSFTGNSLDSPTPAEGGTQFLSIKTVGGTVYINGQENYEFVSTPGLSYAGQQTLVYLPMGATLDFTISTNNSNEPATLFLDGFQYEEVPAPLPISGATMVFAASRQLRGRLRKARKTPAILRLSADAGGHAPCGFACTTARTAAIQRYSARLGLPTPGLQRPLSPAPTAASPRQPSLLGDHGRACAAAGELM